MAPFPWSIKEEYEWFESIQQFLNCTSKMQSFWLAALEHYHQILGGMNLKASWNPIPSSVSSVTACSKKCLVPRNNCTFFMFDRVNKHCYVEDCTFAELQIPSALQAFKLSQFEWFERNKKSHTSLLCYRLLERQRQVWVYDILRPASTSVQVHRARNELSQCPGCVQRSWHETCNHQNTRATGKVQIKRYLH